jgi:hypothetical protein
LYCRTGSPLYCRTVSPLYCRPGSPLYCRTVSHCILVQLLHNGEHVRQ